MASGGWLGLSRGHGQQGARRNRGVARRNRALPARDRARKGWARGNWLTACAGASSEFYEGSPSRWLCPLAARAGASSEFYEGSLSRRWPPEGGLASLEAMGGGVHDRIGALPDGIGLCLLATVPARAEHGGGTVELARRLCGGIVRILRRLSEPPGGRSLEAMGSGVHDRKGALPDGIV